MKNQKEILQKLLATFRIEAEEHLQTISSGLVKLEKESSEEERTKLIETMYREAHSLKGAAHAVNLTDIGTICQSLESIYALLKKKEIPTIPDLFDVLHKSVDLIGELVVSSRHEGEERTAELVAELNRLEVRARERPQDHAAAIPEQKEGAASAGGILQSQAKQQDSFSHGEGSNEQEAARTDDAAPAGGRTEEVKHPLSQTVRIPSERLDFLLRESEEMLSAKLSSHRRVSDLVDIVAAFDLWEKEWTKVQPEIREAAQLLSKSDKTQLEDGPDPVFGKLLAFLEWNRSRIDSLRTNLAGLAKSAETETRHLDRMVDNLLEGVKQVLMLPFSSLLDLFPKMIRDLSREKDKEIELAVLGSDLEIDKRLLEDLKDPLMHLLRNAVDHGIEKPEEREALNKPRSGNIKLAITPINGKRMEVLVSDDGAGIDFEKVKAAAVRTGDISEKEAQDLDEESISSMIYRSGVSTSPIITDISGRGLGLAIVSEKVAKLGGTVSMETRPNVGTTFRILLPLTLSALRGVLLKVADRSFIVPTTSVERVLRVRREEIRTVNSRQTISLNGELISAARLADVLDIRYKERPSRSSEYMTVVVLRPAEGVVAFIVDEVLNEQEVLIKDLGQNLSRVRNVSGSMVMSSGEVALILRVPDLIRSAATASVEVKRGLSPEEGEGSTAKSILIAEDSITSRMLLKNILETAGYGVKTAVDGADALETLASEQIDLLVSDVQMPRMDGFELTAKIRSDETLSELPVVLVTALGSPEQVERGVDVGANAYIIKRDFDQSNLLETVERLI